METVPVLRAAAEAHRNLAELKGRAVSVPNPTILVDTVALQEARASCEIENIVTTQDALYMADLLPRTNRDPATKEVLSYRSAVKQGFAHLQRDASRLSSQLLISLYRTVKSCDDGFRVAPGTAIINRYTGEIVHVPPQEPAEVQNRMEELERFINDDALSALDPLVKMAVIHHQFESIHPFTDGNGRVGRILNVLYLVRCKLLETPILYLSRAISRSKGEYYRRLQAVRDNGEGEAWLLYMLDAVSTTSRHTLTLIERIRSLMAEYKQVMRAELPKIYSHELLNNLFRHPYTRVHAVQRDARVSRPTASRYLRLLTAEGLLRKHRVGRNVYYINQPLVDAFLEQEAG
ncbi:MAG: Fic family protein [Bryobacterales bacterium]|nr:Fic family protein [Bryobacterales bacterium]